MKIKGIISSIVLSVFMVTNALSSVTMVSIGFFDVYLYNQGDSFSFNTTQTSTMNWDLGSQLGSITIALETWSSVIETAPTRQIKIAMGWTTGQTGLAQSGGLYTSSNGTLVSTAETIWRDEKSISMSASQFDINIMFSSSYYSQYSFSETLTAGYYDFASIMAHEMGHALGFSSWGTSSGWTQGMYTTWDRLMDINGKSPGESGFAYKPGNTITIGDSGSLVYNPAPYKSGSSLSHVASSNDPDALMQYSVGKGVRRELSEMELQLMEQMGWDINWSNFYGAIPEPTTVSMLAFCSIYLVSRRKRQLPST